MKTAISIPDELFESADRLAGQLGMSRSELYVTALRQYVQERSGERITEQLNELYEAQGDDMDPVIARLQRRSLSKDGW